MGDAFSTKCQAYLPYFQSTWYAQSTRRNDIEKVFNTWYRSM